MANFWKGLLKIGLWVAGVLLVIGGVLRIFFVTPIATGYDSMAPTFLAGEKVLLWRGSTIEMGDIVVCENPSSPGTMVFGRVMGKAGMTLGTDDRGQFTIERTQVDVDWGGTMEFYDNDANSQVTVRQGIETVGNTEHPIFVREQTEFRLRETRVENGKLFLLGDNRGSRNHDSRSFGAVDEASCIGTVFMRWNPVDRGADLSHGWLDFLD
ncbi:MAG: signal peptidase I [Deltaproteobacteria bacterium]|nr:signal peptidase I [Deltaproteobacteria bacterium]